MTPAIKDDGRALDALGNAVRREIVSILAEAPCAAGQIAARFEISRPAISKHLSVLEAAEVITHQTVGNRNIYRLRRDGFDQARDWLDGFWGEALGRFAMVAENTYDAGGDD